MIAEQPLSAAAAACVSVRFAADGSAEPDAQTARTVRLDCTRMADRIVPTFLQSLESSQHPSAHQKSCVMAGLYRLTGKQMDGVTSAMLNPGGAHAAMEREVVTKVLSGCGL